MNGEIRLTVLVENSVNTRGLRAEHGLAFHVQAGRHQLLFDTGQSDLLLQNACELQLDLRGVEAVVLNHCHTPGFPIASAFKNGRASVHEPGRGRLVPANSMETGRPHP